MWTFGRKALVLFSTWLAHMTIYRAEIIIWAIASFSPFIMLAVWSAKAAQSGTGTIGGFSDHTFAAYFTAAWLASQLTTAWVSWELIGQIRLGELSSKLLKPVHPIWEHIARHLTEKVVRLPFVCLIVAGVLIILPNTTLVPSIWQFCLFLVAVTFAFCIRFLISYAIGLCAFWLQESTALENVYFLLYFFLAGGIAPLELYPSTLRSIVDWTPFPYLIYYPAALLTGTPAAAEPARILAIQLGWIAILFLLCNSLWHRGLRRYGAVGA